MASTCAPVDFVWPHVAKSVRVTGEFCGWNEGVPMTKRDDGVAIISTNDDPLNRMTLAYVDQLEVVVEDIAADDAVRAFVITAEGTKNFSVGMNLKELGAGMADVGVDAFFDQRINLISRIETMGKPSVATLFG